MARISKAEHARILHLVDVDRQKVIDVAAEYGCTPANIYALLGKLRRAAAAREVVGPDCAGSTKSSQTTMSEQSVIDTDPAPRTGLFLVPKPAPPQAAVLRPAADSQAEAAEQQQTGSTIPGKPDGSTLSECSAQADRSAALRQPGTASVIDVYSGHQAKPQRTGDGRAKLKSGFALAMRTVEGDENLTPFRSLEDLLAAVKPILRSAARSTDAIWFSIRPIDLSTFDSDAA